MSLAVGLALMTGVQLAEARTTTGSGDFAVAAASSAPSGLLAPAGTLAPASSPSVASVPSTTPVPTPTTPTPTTPTPTTPTQSTTAASMSASSDASSSEAAAPAPTSAAESTVSSSPETAAATDSPTPEPLPPITAGIPLGLAFPRLEVQAPIDPVGMADGELEVPEDITRLGWWTGSTAAGGPSGTTVIDGHIDSPQGRGVFYHLQEVQPDDQVVLTVAGGATVTYRVTERRSYHKADGLPPEVFATSDQPRLVLITCGGRYDFAKASYDDNIVVIAVPA